MIKRVRTKRANGIRGSRIERFGNVTRFISAFGIDRSLTDGIRWYDLNSSATTVRNNSFVDIGWWVIFPRSPPPSHTPKISDKFDSFLFFGEFSRFLLFPSISFFFVPLLSFSSERSFILRVDFKRTFSSKVVFRERIRKFSE